jgi:hypothetical protein
VRSSLTVRVTEDASTVRERASVVVLSSVARAVMKEANAGFDFNPVVELASSYKTATIFDAVVLCAAIATDPVPLVPDVAGIKNFIVSFVDVERNLFLRCRRRRSVADAVEAVAPL